MRDKHHCYIARVKGHILTYHHPLSYYLTQAKMADLHLKDLVETPASTELVARIPEYQYMPYSLVFTCNRRGRNEQSMIHRVPLKIAFLGILTCFCCLLVLAQTTSLFRPSGPSSFTLPAPVISDGLPSQLGGYTAPLVYLAPCVGQPETPVDMFKKDWNITDYKRFLNQKYWNTTDKILCNDHWLWRSTTYLSWSDVLKELQWPADLVQTSMLIQITPVDGLQTIDPTTLQRQQDAIQQQQADDAKPKNACDFVMPFFGWNFHLDACVMLKTIVNSAIVKPVKNAAQDVINQANTFLWTTPAADTYDLSKNQTMAYFNAVSLNLINIFIVAVIAWLGFRYVLGGGFNWLSYASIQETLPRLLFGLIAAYFAMDIAKVVVDGSNALCTMFHGDMIRNMFSSQPNGTVASIIQMIYAIMGVLLVIEEGARYAVLTILLAFLPFLLFLTALKETAHYAKNAMKALILFTFLQPAQLALMDLGQAILTHVMSNNPGNILDYLIGIAIMIVVLSLFFSVSRMAFGGVAAPLGALATGAVAGLALGTGKLGVKGAMKGRSALNHGLDKTLDAMPKLAYRAPGATAAAYQGIKNAPQNFRTMASNYVAMARKAGTRTATITSGSSGKAGGVYTGNAASKIAQSKQSTYTSNTGGSGNQTAQSQIPNAQNAVHWKSNPPGNAKQYTPAELAQIRAYNAQYAARWRSNPPRSNTSPGKKP